MPTLVANFQGVPTAAYVVKATTFSNGSGTQYPSIQMRCSSPVPTYRVATGASLKGDFRPDGVWSGVYADEPVDFTQAGSFEITVQWPTSQQEFGLSIGNPRLGTYAHFVIASNLGNPARFRWIGGGFNGTNPSGTAVTLPTSVATGDSIRMVLSWPTSATPSVTFSYEVTRSASIIQALTPLASNVALTTLMPGFSTANTRHRLQPGFYGNTIVLTQTVEPVVTSFQLPNYTALASWTRPSNPAIIHCISDSNSARPAFNSSISSVQRVLPRALDAALPFFSGFDGYDVPSGFGVSGALAHATTSSTLAWTATTFNYLNPNFKAATLESSGAPNCVFIMLGTNDAQAGTPTTAAQYEAAIRNIIGWYAAGTKFLIVTPAYFKTNTTANGFIDQYHTRLVTIVSELGSNAYHVDLRSVVDMSGIADGIHWGADATQQGNAATAFATGFRSLLGTVYSVTFDGGSEESAGGYETKSFNATTSPAGGTVTYTNPTNTGPGAAHGVFNAGAKTMKVSGQSAPGGGASTFTILASVFGGTATKTYTVSEAGSGGGGASRPSQMRRGRN